MKKVRKSRFERTKEPEPIALQPRDEMIITLVSEFRFLTREQLQRLLDFPCTTRINIRLRKLYDHGYLSRRFLPTLSGSPKALYLVGPMGTGLVHENLNVASSFPERETKTLLATKDLFLTHQLLLNEVRINFTLAIRNSQQVRLERWSKDQILKLPGSGKNLRPDGYFCLSCRGKGYSFFLEVDCSTMSNARIRSKVMAYLDYARSGLYEKEFGLNYFRVLFVTKTKARLLNLKSTIEKLTDKIFYLCSFDQLSRNPIRDRIWLRVGRPALFPLLEI